jgi:hypothetical protein
MEEIWKDIPGYESYYQASNLGNVKSLDRIVKSKSNSKILKKGIILKPFLGTRGYIIFTLSIYGKTKTYQAHQLVAMAFLNHTPCGHKRVINHKNFIKTDNRLENIEVVTSRVNNNFQHIKTASKYTGVTWHKATQKWYSRITINTVQIRLGLFDCEYQAHLAYQKKLKEIIE